MSSKVSSISELKIHAVDSTDSLVINSLPDSDSGVIPSVGTSKYKPGRTKLHAYNKKQRSIAKLRMRTARTKAFFYEQEQKLKCRMSQVEAQERALRTKTNDLVVKLAKADSLKTEYDEHAKRLERNRDTMADLVHRTDELVQVHKTVKAHVVSRINELTNTYKVIEDTDIEASSVNTTRSSLPKSAISLARTADKLNIHPTVTRIIAGLKDVKIFSYPEYAELQKRLEDSESRLSVLVTENARLSRIIVALEIPNEDAFQKLEAECSMVLDLQKKEHEEEMEQLKRECDQKVEDFCVLARDAKAAAFDRYRYHIRILEDNVRDLSKRREEKADNGPVAPRRVMAVQSGQAALTVRTVPSTPSTPSAPSAPPAPPALATTGRQATPPVQATACAQAFPKVQTSSGQSPPKAVQTVSQPRQAVRKLSAWANSAAPHVKTMRLARSRPSAQPDHAAQQSKDQFGRTSMHAKVTGYDEEFDAYEVKMLLAESADSMNKCPPPHESMYYDETGELFTRPDWKRATKLYFRRLVGRFLSC
ncbi:hypothetical protein DL89DRAFT_268312 [Linderina pennispora]|uniref:Uncharacterized protein n=1 Tax=Linderina pennispora TaxID=61395 RepID=A0A1Y1W4I2_9FUNG|nr:uncharacterized protein DL89DRAFT_268312 [Linderina pennispora]ORX68473.1 hypothetical protein DL89DRAFT_268312 [Linderina pennispora]